MPECHFWADVTLRQCCCVQASRASPAQKSQGLRVDYSKNFSRATFFVFESLSNGGKIYDQFARETNLKKKRCVGLR